jgi:hypothetical protein
MIAMRVTRKVGSTENTSLIMHRLTAVVIVALLEYFAFSVRSRKEPGSSRVINEDRQPFPVYLLYFPFVEIVSDEGQLMLTPKLKERG